MKLLITGGTGSLGRAITRRVLKDGSADRVTILSRDERKQEEMVHDLGDPPQLRMRLGDVRDQDRVRGVMWPGDVDVVIHAAALKRVDNTDPEEVIKTNVDGTRNVVRAAVEAGVERVMVISSDKAVEPVNIYGGTKFLAEQIASSYGVYTPRTGTRVGAVRYGNVWRSRGSVALVWKRAIEAGRRIQITHPEMTRFFISMDQAVAFVLSSVARLQGGEIFVPSLEAFRLADLWTAVENVAQRNNPGWEIIGLRPGEKMHESLLSRHERPRTIWSSDRYLIAPPSVKLSSYWNPETDELISEDDDFEYESGKFPCGRMSWAQLEDAWRSTEVF